jgi:hypothetical protein
MNALSDIKSDFKAIVIKTACYWHRIGELTIYGRESPEAALWLLAIDG